MHLDAINVSAVVNVMTFGFKKTFENDHEFRSAV